MEITNYLDLFKDIPPVEEVSHGNQKNELIGDCLSAYFLFEEGRIEEGEDILMEILQTLYPNTQKDEVETYN